MVNSVNFVSLTLLAVFLGTSSAFVVEDPKNLLMYFKEVVVTIISKQNRDNPDVVYYNSNTTSINYNVLQPAPEKLKVDMDFVPVGSGSKTISTFKLGMTFVKGNGGYWNMSEVTSDIIAGTSVSQTDMKMVPEIKLEAPHGQSFHCSKFAQLIPDYNTNKKLGNFTPTIEIRGLQVQAFDLVEQKFTEPWECVGFFSAGIWSGIFIVSILIGILTWGLAMIMDVKTMDRFDDPKGKAISFGAGSE